VVIALFLTRPTIDYWGILCVGLSIVAGRDVRAPWDFVWIGILCAATIVGLILAFGPEPGVAYMPVYIAGCLLVGLYGRATRNSEIARERSEVLLKDLEQANARLRDYSQQAERNAVAQERTRLSRELHDAATQTVFSIHFTAEAARMARTEDPERLPSLLDRLEELSRDALAELRVLVRELRPPSIGEESLSHALERHAAMRERRDRVRVTVSVRGKERCGAAAKQALFGAVVEALNNVVKHAGVSEAAVGLSFDGREAVVRVTDNGIGFDVSAAGSPGRFGLVSMRERMEAINGTLSVRSAPGEGTEVEVRLPLQEEESE
jgi:signal transduction histidine kinase